MKRTTVFAEGKRREEASKVLKQFLNEETHLKLFMVPTEKSCLKPMPVIDKPPCQMQSAPASKSLNIFPPIAAIKWNCMYPDMLFNY